MPFKPDTQIRLYKDTRVDPGNQPYFSSEGAKISWYNSHVALSFTGQSYQRERRQYARVDYPAAMLRGYDMMSFHNAEDDRWIFARIIGTEFVNPNATDVFFVVDPMQTWIDQIQWVDCWVEREMVDDDWNGSLPGWKSLAPEGLECGQLSNETLADFSEVVNSTGWQIKVLSAYDRSAEENYSIKTIGNYVSGLNEFTLAGPSDLEALLTTYANKGRLDGIVGIWMFPTRFGADWAAASLPVTLPTTINGYTPKNSKVFSSEFCSVCISNRMGDSIELAPEFLFQDSNTMNFWVQGAFLDGGGGLICYPGSYMGLPSKQSQDYGVTLPANVQTAYVGNAFANWVAQNRAPLILEGAKSLGQIGLGVAGMASPAIELEGASAIFGAGVESAASTLTTIMQKASNPAGAHGQAYAQAMPVSNGTYGFIVSLRTPSAQMAESIDNFFSVYGYKVCRMKKPNVNTRPFWNYVKCAPAIVGGPMNSTDRAEIEKMLNAGVTFWNVPSATIGDYSPDNRG